MDFKGFKMMNVSNRKKLTDDLRTKDSTYFAEISHEQKLDYLEAIAEQNWQGENIKELYENKTFTNNLKACLFGVKPSDDMLKEERYKIGRFINFLKFSGIKEKIVDGGQGLGEKWQSLGEDEKIGVVNDFVRAYTRIYGIDDVNEIVFRDGKEMTYSCCYREREKKIFMDRNMLSGDRIESQFLFPVLFHELTHHQQACLWCNDSEKYRIFNPLFNKFKASTYLYNRKDNDEIYSLMPTEMHAYWSQREFEQKASEELFNNKSLRRKNLDVPMYAALLAYYGGKNI